MTSKRPISVVALVGSNLRRCREEQGLSQAELSKGASIPRQTISLIELGLTRPAFATFLGLAAALRVEAEILLVGVRWEASRDGRPGHFRFDWRGR